MEGTREVVTNKISILLHVEENPKTYSKAITYRDVAFRKEVISDEMDPLLYRIVLYTQTKQKITCHHMIG